MVDLHNALRPNQTAEPLPVSEITARAKRRKRRRATSATGLTVATLGIAAVGIVSLAGSPPPTSTVADGSADQPTETTASPAGTDATSTTERLDGPVSTTPPATAVDETGASLADTEQTSSSLAPDGTAPDDSQPATTPGIQTSSTTTSEWATGYCVQVEVLNDGVDAVDRDTWQVALDLGGTIAEVWSANAVDAGGGTFVFSGLPGYNEAIGAGSVTSFGTCVDTVAD